MDPNYYPEVGTSKLPLEDKIMIYQMLVVSANWAVSLGLFDVHYTVSTLARCNKVSREGHLKAILLRLFDRHYWNKLCSMLFQSLRGT